MVGPVVYEASVPFLRKALQNQIKLLKAGQEWCNENGHETGKLTEARLGSDTFGLSFHVKFCTYNAVQLVIDLGIVHTDSLDIDNKECSLDDLVARVEQALKLLEQATAEKFAGKEEMEVDVFLGNFSVKRDALTYVHEISLPSFWFHHSMVYSILWTQGVQLSKQLFLSAW